MKRLSIIVFLSIAIAVGLSACNKHNDEKVVEGKVTGFALSVNTESGQISATAIIEKSDGTSRSYKIANDNIEKMLPTLAFSNYSLIEPNMYVRLIYKKGSNHEAEYSLQERAVMSYDHGTPPVFLFTSDNKIVGYYRDNRNNN